MSHKGSYKPGTIIPISVAFNNDLGSAEDPVNPTAVLKKPDETFVALTAPVKLNNTIGWFGTNVDTTGFTDGLYEVYISGTVTTDKTPSAVFSFQIENVRASDVNTSVGLIPINPLLVGDPILANLDAPISNIPTTTVLQNDLRLNNLDAPISGIQPGASLADIEESQILAKEVSVQAIPTNPLLNDDPLLLNLDAKISSRLASQDYAAPDNQGISNIYEKVDTELQTAINEITLIRSKTDTLGAGLISIISPVSADGTEITLIAGDDYDADESRALDFVDSDNSWPVLSNAIVRFYLADKIIKDCEILVAQGDSKQIRLELTSIETTQTSGTYPFEIVAILENLRKITLVMGTAKVIN